MVQVIMGLCYTMAFPRWEEYFTDLNVHLKLGFVLTLNRFVVDQSFPPEI